MASSSPKFHQHWLSENVLPDIPSEITFQRYLLLLHYRKLEYQNLSAQFLAKQTSMLTWFASDMAHA
ncbi:hypothetical protein [Larkinella harenae]